jgi:hypothetical protein
MMDGGELTLFHGSFDAALEHISALHEERMHRISYSWHKGRHRRIISRMQPLASKFVAKLLKLPYGCNALLIDVAHVTSS